MINYLINNHSVYTLDVVFIFFSTKYSVNRLTVKYFDCMVTDSRFVTGASLRSPAQGTLKNTYFEGRGVKACFEIRF